MKYKLPDMVAQDDKDYRNQIQNFMLENMGTFASSASETCGCNTDNLTLPEMYDLVPASFTAVLGAPGPEFFEYYFNKAFSKPTSGTFPVLVRYRMPGTGEVTTERNLNLQW